MNGSDLKNQVKIDILHENAKLFQETHPELFQKLMTNRDFKLEHKKLHSFCTNQRIYLKKGIWDENSNDCEGLFSKHHELLDKIGFAWE